MSDPEYSFTADEIEAGIGAAVRERNFDVIPGLVKLLALQDPARAHAALDALHALNIQL